MTIRIPTLLAVTLGLCMALTSFMSASMMAPDRASPAREIQALTFGPSDKDLCAELPGHAHHCPFCHALPEPAGISFAAVQRAFLPQDNWTARAALQRAARPRNVAHSTRAPPRIA